jgi:zinc transport system permease protein
MEITEMLRTIVQEFPFALFGSVLAGVLCAFIGVYVVARRVVFLGAVLTQVSVFGIALTFLPFIPMNHTIGSLVVTLLAVVGLSRLLSGARVPRDAVLGIVFVAAIALRILIMQKTPKVEVAEIENLLRGDILFITPELFFLMLGVFVVTMAVHLLFFKEFTYISFDAETARTQGFKAEVWEILFYVLAAVVISVATHMVGDVMVFGFLVAPPAGRGHRSPGAGRRTGARFHVRLPGVSGDRGRCACSARGGLAGQQDTRPLTHNVVSHTPWLTSQISHPAPAPPQAAPTTALMAAKCTMSLTLQPRERSNAGFRSPWTTGPTASAPARRCASL